MTRTLAMPDAAEPPERHADFLELHALSSSKQGASFQELVRNLRIGNVAEVIADSSDFPLEVEDCAEAVAQSAFDEIDERRRNFGTQAARYPFETTGNSVNLQSGGAESLYAFLALLSWFGKDAGPPGADGEKIFEEVSAQAAVAYFGGPGERVKSYVFGFPRRMQPKGFAAALDHLCATLGEGGGHHKGRPLLPDQKDGKLDLVSWVEFPDSREGKLVAFGQCATGRNWHDKISELPPPDRWCGHWMAETPTVLPLRSFFVPHRVERDRWIHSCAFGGILFDRCRIASLASNVSSELRSQWTNWSAHVLGTIREAAQ